MSNPFSRRRHGGDFCHSVPLFALSFRTSALGVRNPYQLGDSLGDPFFLHLGPPYSITNRTHVCYPLQDGSFLTPAGRPLANTVRADRFCVAGASATGDGTDVWRYATHSSSGLPRRICAHGPSSGKSRLLHNRPSACDRIGAGDRCSCACSHSGQ